MRKRKRNKEVYVENLEVFHVKRRRHKVRFIRNAQAWAFLIRSLVSPLHIEPAAPGFDVVSPAGGKKKQRKTPNDRTFSGSGWRSRDSSKANGIFKNKKKR